MLGCQSGVRVLTIKSVSLTHTKDTHFNSSLSNMYPSLKNTFKHWTQHKHKDKQDTTKVSFVFFCTKIYFNVHKQWPVLLTSLFLSFFNKKSDLQKNRKCQKKPKAVIKKRGKTKAKIIQQKSIGSYSHAPEGGVGKAHQSELVWVSQSTVTSGQLQRDHTGDRWSVQARRRTNEANARD